MKRPTWATIVGTIGIVVCIFRILGAGQMMIMPQIMELQKEMIASIEKQNTADPKERKAREAASKMFDKMLYMPEWFKTWVIIIGLVSAAVSGVYLLASIMLLLTKKAAIKLFCAAAGFHIALAILVLIVAILNMSFMAILMMVGSGFSLIIDIVLLIVVANGTKEAFYGAGQAQGT